MPSGRRIVSPGWASAMAAAMLGESNPLGSMTAGGLAAMTSRIIVMGIMSCTVTTAAGRVKGHLASPSATELVVDIALQPLERRVKFLQNVLIDHAVGAERIQGPLRESHPAQ